jgi:hypothetical protein
MPAAALAHLAKARHIDMDRAEHLWDKAKGIVAKEYGKKNKGYWALVMGITKKMMGMKEELTTFEKFLTTGEAPLQEAHDGNPMANLLSYLLIARNVAHMWHWKVKSFAQHMALGELYEALEEYADELAEMYMGVYGDNIHISLSDPNPFSEQDPIEFVNQLNTWLHDQHDKIQQDGFIVNKFEELQAAVATVKYKLENLR